MTNATESRKAVTDRPILFSAPMVRALLAGTKTQTRRLAWRDCRPHESGVRERLPAVWQKARPGDRLWVKESFALPDAGRGLVRRRGLEVICYTADEGFTGPRMKQYDRKRKRSIFMPRWASRLTLVVTETRRERLQDISAEDCVAEGCEIEGMTQNTETGEMEPADDYWLPFSDLWESIHGDGAWDENPELVAITFTVHKTNIDALGATPEEDGSEGDDGA